MLAGAAGPMALAGWMAARRDVGEGLLRASDAAASDPRLLSSPAAEAFRDERGRLLAWTLGAGLFAAIIGVLADSVSSADVSEGLNRQLEKLGTGSITTASGYIAFNFLLFILVACLFASSQVAAARHEEEAERLETLLAQPLGRRAWLTGRLALATGGAVVLTLVVGTLTWCGAASQGAAVSFGEMVAAGANCLPVALLFLGLGALAFALVPRATAGISYGLVLLAFVWELFGSLLELPGWAVDLSPFHRVGLIPAESFKAGPALAMLALASLAAGVAMRLFEQRDLTGS